MKEDHPDEARAMARAESILDELDIDDDDEDDVYADLLLLNRRVRLMTKLTKALCISFTLIIILLCVSSFI